jgi:hypothetical protein
MVDISIVNKSIKKIWLIWSSQLLTNQLDNISTNGKPIWQNDYGKSMWHQLD